MPNNHTVLITGAAGGIGRATVSLFAQNGWQVIGVDRAAFGEEFPTNGLFIQADISRPEDMQAIATLDTKTSSFFDHRDPNIVKQLGEAKRPT